MHIIVVKARTILIGFAAVAAAILLMLSPRALDTFNSTDGRQLPVYNVGRNDNRIALTFDCAWNDDDIDSILQTLKDNKCTAAFFVTGDFVEKYPSSVEKIHNAGHIVGNHSYNHADYSKMNTQDIQKDVQKADECIKKVCGEVPLYMRMPSGAYNDNAIESVESMGKICVQWSIDSIDYKDSASEASILSKLAKTNSGDIILMHNGTKLTAKLLPKIIKGLKKSYEFVSLDELIYKENFKIGADGKQVQTESGK